MKTRHMTTILLCALTLGCASQRHDFANFTAYLDRTDPSLPDAAGFVDMWHPLCDSPDASIPFLKSKLTSLDPHERIAAYAALQVLTDAIRKNPTPAGLDFLKLIDPRSVYEQFNSFDPSSLSKTWQSWFAKTHEFMRKDLESDGRRLTQ